MSLAAYKSKRSFEFTGEPEGAEPFNRGPRGSQIPFVIQKHAASRLHYDFRLQIDGVLKSWAVPKGVPLLHGEKRLAMQVEDHPSEYGAFEGTIPKGNYGAGTVMLWDAGVCNVLGGTPRAALRAGKLVFQLHGQKLSGKWTLVRMRPRENRDEKAWLLIKTEGDAAPVSARSDDRSILSRRTMKQINTISDRTWQSHPKSNSNRIARRYIRPSRGQKTAMQHKRPQFHS